MTTVLVSPTDDDLAAILKGKAITSIIPEQKGADVLIYTPQGLIGLQRKEVPHDFIASFTDGRMSRETTLLAEHCKFRWLVCEGRFRFYPDGKLVVDRKEPSRFTRAQVYGMLLDVKLIKDVNILYTDDLEDTAFLIKVLIDFMSAKKHLGLYSRPSAKGDWYVPTTEDLHLWLLQSFPGIGPSIADDILKHFGGIPLRWTCTLDELVGVPKLRGKVAKELWDSLPHGPESVSVFDSLREKLHEAGEAGG